MSGTNPTHASGHRLKFGKERISSRAESAAIINSTRAGACARTLELRRETKVESFRSRPPVAIETASCMNRSLTYDFGLRSLDFGLCLCASDLSDTIQDG